MVSVITAINLLKRKEKRSKKRKERKGKEGTKRKKQVNPKTTKRKQKIKTPKSNKFKSKTTKSIASRKKRVDKAKRMRAKKPLIQHKKKKQGMKTKKKDRLKPRKITKAKPKKAVRAVERAVEIQKIKKPVAKSLPKTLKAQKIKKIIEKGEQRVEQSKMKPTTQEKSKVEEGVERDIKIVNIVVSTSLGRDMPLERMAATFSNTEYNPEQFPGLVFRIKYPKTSALIFSSGRIVCTGAKSMEKVRESIQHIINSLAKIGVDVTIEPEISVQNIVAAGSIGMNLNLNLLAMKLENTEYEPEQFPGLVYKLLDAKATFLLFRNGKIVCTGTKSEQEVYQAIDLLVKKLKSVQK